MWEMRPVGYFENPNSPRLRSASRVRGGSQTPIRPHADTASLRRSIFTRNCQMPTDILTARPACNSPPTRKHTRVWDSLDRRDAYPLRTLLPHTRNPRSGLNEVRIHDSCASYALSLLQLNQPLLSQCSLRRCFFQEIGGKLHKWCDRRRPCRRYEL